MSSFISEIASNMTAATEILGTESLWGKWQGWVRYVGLFAPPTGHETDLRIEEADFEMFG